MQYVRRSRVFGRTRIFSGRDGCCRSAFVSVLRGSKGVAARRRAYLRALAICDPRCGSCNARRARRSCRGTRLAACNADPAPNATAPPVARPRQPDAALFRRPKRRAWRFLPSPIAVHGSDDDTVEKRNRREEIAPMSTSKRNTIACVAAGSCVLAWLSLGPWPGASAQATFPDPNANCPPAECGQVSPLSRCKASKRCIWVWSGRRARRIPRSCITRGFPSSWSTTWPTPSWSIWRSNAER